MNDFILTDTSWFDEKEPSEKEDLLFEETSGLNPGQLLVDMYESENESFVKLIEIIHEIWKNKIILKKSETMRAGYNTAALHTMLYTYGEALKHNFAPIISEKLKNGEY